MNAFAALRARLGPELVVASHNPGKLREVAELFDGADVALTSAASLGLPEPEETGDTFLANALLKSRAGALGSGKPALADDSGLCVEALGGAPGIYSARWAGPQKSFADAMERVRRELVASGAKPPWRAYFISVLALSRPDGSDESYEGRVDGTLVFPPSGDKGFGYDPIFLPDGESRTFGEMSAFEKHGLPRRGGGALSHRARAFMKAFPEIA